MLSGRMFHILGPNDLNVSSPLMDTFRVDMIMEIGLTPESTYRHYL